MALSLLYLIILSYTFAIKSCRIPEDVILNNDAERFYEVSINDYVEYKGQTIKITEIDVYKTTIRNKVCIYDTSEMIEISTRIKASSVDINNYCATCIPGNCYPFIPDEEYDKKPDIYKEIGCKKKSEYFDYVEYNQNIASSYCEYTYKGFERVENETCGEEIKLLGYMIKGQVQETKEYIEVPLNSVNQYQGLYMNGKLIINYQDIYHLICEPGLVNCIMNKDINDNEVSLEINTNSVQIPFSDVYSEGLEACVVESVIPQNCDCKTKCYVNIKVKNEPCRFANELVMCDASKINVILPEEYCKTDPSDSTNPSSNPSDNPSNSDEKLFGSIIKIFLLILVLALGIVILHGICTCICIVICCCSIGGVILGFRKRLFKKFHPLTSIEMN